MSTPVQTVSDFVAAIDQATIKAVGAHDQAHAVFLVEPTVCVVDLARSLAQQGAWLALDLLTSG